MNSKCAGRLGRWLTVLAISLGTSLAVLAAEMASFPLTIKEGRFSPEVVEVPAGEKFKLIVKNEGPGAEEFESSDLNREKVIPAGRQADITLGPLKPGSYHFYGEFNPKTANGQIIAK